MVLIAGVMIDKLGICFSSLFFISICMIGSVLFAAAYYLPYPLIWLILGRTVLGFGGESLTVCQQTMLGRWFTGSFLNFAFGFTQVRFLSSPPHTGYTTKESEKKEREREKKERERRKKERREKETEKR